MITCIFENETKAHLRHTVVNAIIIKNNKILLGKRGVFKDKPITEFGKWGLIGGYLNRNEILVDGLKREVKEETGWEIATPQLFVINDTPNRTMEDKQNIDIIFITKALKRDKNFISNEEISDLRWFEIEHLPESEEMAFDHAKSLFLYKKYLKRKFQIPILAKFG